MLSSVAKGVAVNTFRSLDLVGNEVAKNMSTAPDGPGTKMTKSHAPRLSSRGHCRDGFM